LKKFIDWGYYKRFVYQILLKKMKKYICYDFLKILYEQIMAAILKWLPKSAILIFSDGSISEIDCYNLNSISAKFHAFIIF